MQHNSIPSEIQATAATGWLLVPISVQKRPLIREWPEKASADLIQLGTWAAGFSQPNWAVMTGPESGIWVLDTDNEAGAEWLAKQIEIHGEGWTLTRKVRTGREGGGFHHYYLWPQNEITIRNSSCEIAAGVDVRGWHGLAILPPSLHSSGRRYAWETPISHPILEAPDWLLETVKKTNAQPISPSRVKNGTEKGEPTIPVGERHKFLVSLAGTMQGRGMRPEAIEAALLVEHDLSCIVPKQEQEVKAIAADIASRYPREPQLILPGAGNSRAKEVEFETAAEFTAMAPPVTQWIVPPWIPERSLVELTGKVKASGKTTLALNMVKAALDGDVFLDRVCQKTPCVYLNEMPETALREALVKAGLGQRADLHLLRWHKAMGMEWERIVSAAMEKALRVEARLVVIDTLSQFTQLVGDAENDSGQALRVLLPLQQMQERGITTLIVRHEKKGDGAEISDAGRGSSAYAGAVDVLMRLRRLGAKHPANHRRLETLSRFDQTPPEVLIELTADGYQLRETSAVTLLAAEKAVLEVLPASESESLTMLDLTAKTKHTRTPLDRVLTELIGRKLVKRVGAGVRGCAYRFHQIEGDGSSWR